MVNPAMAASHGIDSMAQTAENLAREFNISREDQDAFALRSQQRAGRATANGRFALEITSAADLVQDEPVRVDSTLQGLAALAPLLGPGTSITAGNASGLSDGACVLLLASGKAAERWQLTPLARILSMASAGVAPRTMGLGPVPAIERLLTRLDHSFQQFDLIEINEAFAAQVLAVTRSLSLADAAPHVNRNGGAIALGHPLGASGARLVLTAMHEIASGAAQNALVALCVGVGQGLALALERPR
jgi:acetyl-CoA acetyltransferase family protein